MDIRYPIGKFEFEGEIPAAQREKWIAEISEFPGKLKEAVQGLSEEQLDLPYREGGWTVRKVVHHLADSHINSYTRFKLALTEEKPAIKPYFEDRWANLSDALTGDIQISIKLLEALHTRWVILLNSLNEVDFKKQFYHPESGQSISLDYNLGFYAWHGNHHIAHITALRERLNI
ncbi:YfiT family bacillithiol transferase [Paenibacillus caui]|uniref:YfiT family bacillithiol transferase n=1 Tax=Paenibacillus caui TaxID=2873927 RepID=UPI001EEF4ADF|nr:bacillithiol transferase BstA [Paenibacillus caui]